FFHGGRAISVAIGPAEERCKACSSVHVHRKSTRTRRSESGESRSASGEGGGRVRYTRRGENVHVCPAEVNPHKLSLGSRMRQHQGRRPCASSPSRTKTSKR